MTDVGLGTQQVSRVVALLVALSVVSGGTAAVAASAPCPGNPDALGVSRVLQLDAGESPRLGRMQYRRSLPLDDREVVLTFDDGPIPPYTDRVLEILAPQCVKATFFLVGRHTAANPDAARRVFLAGHTIGNHSQNHVLRFNAIAETRAEHEFAMGAAVIRAALGAPKALSPFVRIPGLGRTRAVEQYMQAHGQVVWSADTVADDWTRITSKEVLKRALRRLEAKGKGILLLHDIQPRTVLMLPALLAELRRRHFRIVHVVPQDVVVPPVPLPVETTIAARADKLGWPRVVSSDQAAIPVRVAEMPADMLAANDGVPAAPAVPENQSTVTAPETVPLPPRRKPFRQPHRTRTASLAPEHRDTVIERLMSR